VKRSVAGQVMRPTIRQVAQHARVSVSTVSRVMRDHPDVSDETRQAVQQVIDSLGYRPSLLARGLILKRTNSLGLIVSDITNPFYPQLAKGLEEAASTRGWVVIMGNTESDSSRTERHVDAMLERGVDGIVFASVTTGDETVPRLVDANYPVVLVNRRLACVDTHYVVVDNVRGAELATTHLVELGHKRIAHITGPQYAANTVERRQGYALSLRNAGLEVSDDLVSAGDFSVRGGDGAMQRLLDLSEPPTAVFVTNDFMALGALEAIKAAGLRWPDDLAVVGFDDIALAGSSLIELSTVSGRIYEMGARAVGILLDLITEAPPQRAVQEVLEPKLIVRRTCGGIPS